MKLLDSFKLVWRNLWRMKLRTILTSVGVTIGTAAIVSMISLGIGLQQNAVKSLENFGNLTELEIHPGFRTPDGEPIPPDQRKTLNWDAVNELKSMEGISAVMPKKNAGSIEMQYGRLQGHFEIMGVYVPEARFFKGDDIAKGSFLSGAPNEIVIAYQVPENLRDEEREEREMRRRRMQERSGGNPGAMPMRNYSPPPVDLVGETVTLVLTRTIRTDDDVKLERKELRVRVVGQLMQEDDRRYSNTIYAPLSLIDEIHQWNRSGGGGRMEFMVRSAAGMSTSVAAGDSRRSRGREAENEVEFDSIIAKVESREKVEAVVKEVQERGYETWSPARALEEINKFFRIVQLILGGIAAVSLFVATIGIVNTMIMSILERTKEIGIMKVIGATVFNIRWLFLIESGTIGLIGGLTGLGLSYGAVGAVNMIAKNSNFNLFGGGPPGQEAAAQIAVVPLWLATFAIAFSFLIGLIAGIYPAFRASRLSALKAIRSD